MAVTPHHSKLQITITPSWYLGLKIVIEGTRRRFMQSPKLSTAPPNPGFNGPKGQLI
jgi:hypothetical protein